MVAKEHLSNTKIKHLRHDARELEHLSWQVGHVGVHKDKKWLYDPHMGGEAGGKGGQEPVDDSN